MGNSDPHYIIKQVTTLIEERRRRAGISHEALAEASGVHRSTVSRVESGTINATLLVFLSLAKALNVRLGTLINEAERKLGNPKPRAKKAQTVKKQSRN